MRSMLLSFESRPGIHLYLTRQILKQPYCQEVTIYAALSSERSHINPKSRTFRLTRAPVRLDTLRHLFPYRPLALVNETAIKYQSLR